MLTDIFSNRYTRLEIWPFFAEPQRRLVAQSFRILVEQICPYYKNGAEWEHGKKFWRDLHDRIATELGVKFLSAPAYTYQTMWQGKASTHSETKSYNAVCEDWMLKAFDDFPSPDMFIKERLSLVEIGFRTRSEEISIENETLETRINEARYGKRSLATLRVPGDIGNGMTAQNASINSQFKSCVDDLNARFRQSGSPVNYHNGFIQISSDFLSERQIETPFWDLLLDKKWENVDADMKRAVDLRDTNGPDPAFHASKALESTIKIISGEKGWTCGKENGAHNFIDNLASKKAKYIVDWEAKLLKEFFTGVRNPLGHGPGEKPKKELSTQGTDWAIENCMSWIKSLIDACKDRNDRKSEISSI